MAARKGNQYWKLRSKHGRNKEHTPESLLNAAYEYFELVEKTPFKVVKLFGTGLKDNVPQPRPFTLGGFCLYANICENTFRNYQNDKDFLRVTKEIEQIIYNNKFEGAASGLFNANIIARDLGLADKKEVDVKAEITSKEEIQDELRQLGIEDS